MKINHTIVLTKQLQASVSRIMDKLHSLLADNIKAVLDYKGHVKQCGCKMIFFNDEIAN